MSMKKFKKLISMTLAASMVVGTGSVIPAVTPSTTIEAEAADNDKGYEERLTPHMGWAPWNEFEIHTTGDIFIQQMDLMKEYGLVDVGYIYFTTEETWQDGRDENGVLQVNKEKFPHGEGMEYYAAYAHSLGMKAGIYSDVGVDTCVSGRQNSPGNGQGFGYYPYENSDEYLGNCLGVGLYGHDEEDLRMLLMDWDYDFIKVDWCGGRNLGWSVQGKGGDRYNEVGEVIEKLRKEKGKDILFNVCCWQFPGAKVVNGDCDSWRTGGDLWASWSSILQAIDKTKEIKDGKPVYEYSAPGKFNDLDMLQVGRGLTYEEDKSHFSMWCMASSPLSIGMDLSKITPETLAIFKNTEMIAIDQDPACIGASVAKTIGSNNFNDGDSQPVEIWRKDLGKKGSQTKAIALFNRANKERTITVNWEELGFNGDVLARDLWQHKYIDVKENHTVTIPAHGTIVYKVTGEEGSGNTTVTEEAQTLKMELDVLDKPAQMDLTKTGTADWIYYGESNGTNFRRKANVEPQLEFVGDFATGLDKDGYYNDSCTAYSWTDGTPQQTGNGVTHGRTIGKTMGTYGQIDAASDSREHVLYIPIAGWRSTNTIEILVNGKVVKTQEVKPEQWTDGQQRVNKLVKVTYATDIPTKISVRWTITGQMDGRGTTGVEAAALYVDPTQEASTIYASATDFLDNEVDLEAKGSLDYMQFGGANGDVAAEKAGVNLLQKYTLGDIVDVKTADSTVTYKVGNTTIKKGAVQSALSSQFIVTLPAVDEMTEANIYLGVKDAEVTARAVTGTAIFEEKLVNIGTGTNKVLNIYYKSASPVKVALTLTGTMGNDPQMRLDAVTLAKNTGTIVLNPAVSQSDTNISINTRIIRQGNSTEAKKVEAKLYDASGNVKNTKTADVSSGTDTTTHMDVELVRDFAGKLEVKVLDASNNAIGKTFVYQLPMANIEDSGLIGHYTAKKLVKEKNAILVDVRSKEEFAESGIKGTLNIPLADLALNGEAALASVGVTKASTIIVYCASGRRSQQARQILQYMGYANTYDLRGYENWLEGANVNFTNYQEIILNNTPIYLTLEGIAYEEVELRYSIGKDSTINDSKAYTGPITLSKSDRIKAYVLFEGNVVYESYDDYLVFVDELPDFAALEKLEGKFCSDMEFIVEESHESYTPDRTQVTPTIEGIKYDKNSKGQEMKIKGHKFAKGVAAHAPSVVTYNIPEGMNRFVAVAGVDDTAGDRSKDYTVLFSIFIDGRLADQVIRMTTGRFYTFDIEIPNGAKKLQLVAKKGNSSLHSGENMFTEWGFARFVKDPNYKGNNPTSANLALNKPVIATGNQDSSHSAIKAVDGKKDVSRWSTAQAPNGGALPQAIQIDLGAIYELDTISSYWFGDGREYTYSIYLTDKPTIELDDEKDELKGGTLRTDIVPIVAQKIGYGYGVSGEGVQIKEEDIVRTNYDFLGRARGRYLTINVTKSTGVNLASIWEIEVYGTKVGESEEELKELPYVDPTVAEARTKLSAAITQAEAYKEAEYTTESWAALKTALDAAKKAVASETATAAELTTAATNLDTAVKALKRNDGETLPTETEQKPTETEQKPTETEQKPTETEQKPTETEQKPTETETPPTSINPLPPESESESNQKPTETEQKPTESQKPSESNGPGQNIVLTPEETQFVSKLGVSKETAQKISALAAQQKISTDTLLVTDASIKALKNDKDVKGSSFALFQARASKQTKNSIKLKWNKLANADGYAIYGNKCGKKYEYIGEVSGKTSYTQKGLKKGTYYKYIVRAYKVVDGTKVTIAASKTIHAVTKGGKYGVATKVTVKKSNVKLNRGKTFKLNAKEVNKNLKIKKHRSLKYESTNTKVAKVSSKGKITAVGKGTCQVYVYAQNGVYKKVKVTVK